MIWLWRFFLWFFGKKIQKLISSHEALGVRFFQQKLNDVSDRYSHFTLQRAGSDGWSCSMRPRPDWDNPRTVMYAWSANGETIQEAIDNALEAAREPQKKIVGNGGRAVLGDQEFDG